MEIQHLERALRNLMSSSSPQAALAGVAGNGHFGTEISAEFVDAAKSLLERKDAPQRRSILGVDMPGWT